MRKLIAGAALSMALGAAQAAIQEEAVTYRDGDTVMKGFIVYDNASKVKSKLLVLNGADDPFIKPDTVEAFKKEMDAAKVDYRYVNYPGAVHAFTNPEATAKGKQFNLPLAYHPDADKRSKTEAAKFFSSVFK